MKKINQTSEAVTYYFICEGCKSEGELEVPAGHQDFSCPEGCGARYIQWQKPDGAVDLACVVCPVFAEGELVEVPL